LGDLGLSKRAVQILQGGLFAEGGIWSIYLAVKLQQKWSLAIIPGVIGIGFVALAWHRVIF